MIQKQISSRAVLIWQDDFGTTVALGQAAVATAGKRVPVRGRRAVHQGPVQPGRAGRPGAELRSGRFHGARQVHGRRVSRVRGRTALRSGARPVRDDGPGHREDDAQIRGRSLRTLSPRVVRTFARLAHR